MSCKTLLAQEWEQPVAPGAERRYAINLHKQLSKHWADQLDYEINDQVPAGTTGFDAKCTVAGRRGSAEPRWLKTLGATHPDGSVTWQLVNPTAASLDTTIETFVWTLPAGLTLASQSDQDTQSSAILQVAASAAPGRYEVVITATCVNDEVIVQPCILTVE